MIELVSWLAVAAVLAATAGFYLGRRREQQRSRDYERGFDALPYPAQLVADRDRHLPPALFPRADASRVPRIGELIQPVARAPGRTALIARMAARSGRKSAALRPSVPAALVTSSSTALSPEFLHR